MVKFLINRPVAVFMTFFALLLLGVFSSFLLPVSLLPDINIPEITVRISYPGRPVVEMEQSIVAPLRLQLIQIPGLADMESESRDGEGTIKLKFNYGINIDYIFVEVNEKVDMAMADLPRDVPRPRVIKASASDLPVFYLNISHSDTSIASPDKMLELSQLASKVIRKRIEQMPEVALADITGTTSPELVIVPNFGIINALGISVEQIEQAINQSMFSFGSIRLREGQLIFDVIIEQNVVHPQDVKGIPIKANDRLFTLGEIASIELKPARNQGAYLYNGQLAVCIPIIKHSNARMSDLKKATHELVEQLHNDYPSLSFSISHDQTKILDLSISNLRNSLIAGVFLAVTAMFLFLGDYRNPVLMGITIPVSLVIGMMFFHLSSLSVNIVSLSGLILGVGMMIDNSIVVIDNITQWRARGTILSDAVVGATNEVIRPLLSSMLTTVAVFIPLIFLSGISGAMFLDQALAVSIGLAVSFWVSITLLPTIYYVINKKTEGKWMAIKSLIPLEDSYKKGFSFIFQNRKLFLLIALVILLVCPMLFLGIDKRQMPELTRTETMVNISWGKNINLDENLRRCNELISSAETNTIESAFFVGRQQLLLSKHLEMGESDASLYFKFNSKGALGKANEDIRNYINHMYQDASVSFSFPESAFERVFPTPSSRLIIKVSGKDGNLTPSPGKIDSLLLWLQVFAPNASISSVPTQMQLNLIVNPTSLTLNRLSIDQVKRAIESALQSNRIGSLNYEQQVIPIIYGENPETLHHILSHLTIKNIEGADVPVRSLVNAVEVLGFRSVFGDNTSTYIPININAPDPIISSIIETISTLNNGTTNANFRFSGDFYKSQKLFWELLGVLVVSILLLYFILAAQFESLKQPLIVLIELPLDVAGALAIIWLLGGSINLMSMIGLVVMGGIIVNDSILKIDTINRLRKSGLPLMEAIAEGGKRRLKPIVMTSLTTVLALTPILFGNDLGSELQKPLALATIGGMVFGTLVSLYFIPLAYWWMYRKKVQEN